MDKIIKNLAIPYLLELLLLLFCYSRDKKAILHLSSLIAPFYYSLYIRLDFCSTSSTDCGTSL